MKTIVVTGASDGIGAAAARKLHADGHRVVVVGRSPEKAAAVAKELGRDSAAKPVATTPGWNAVDEMPWSWWRRWSSRERSERLLSPE
jgi:NAD(P)-dependent dehydrogenase (short-subunit alcohol dehydrogenase family)